MNNSQVAHEFNAQHRKHASGSNFRFEGKVIYSYSTPIAWIEPFAGFVVMSSRHYSVTTCKHQNAILRACSNRKIIHVDRISDAGYDYYAKDNMLALEKGLMASITAYDNCQWKNKEFNHMVIIMTLDHATAYGEIVKFTGRADIIRRMNTAFDRHMLKYEMDKPKIAEMAELNRIKEEKRERARLARIEEHNRLAVPAWISGRNDYYNENGNCLPCIPHNFNKTYCRYVASDDSIETSRGAKVGIKPALLFYRAIKAGKDIKGMQIDSFTAISHVDGIVKIGCHVLEIAELDRCFATLPEDIRNS